MKIIYDLFYENDQLSLTRLLAFLGYLLFAIGSFYLMWNNMSWSGYETFAIYTGGGGTALQFANKFINSKYNSVSGSYETTEQFNKRTKSSTINLSTNTSNTDPNTGTK